MYMADLLPIPVVHHHPIVISYAQFLGDQLYGHIQFGQHFRWGGLEIGILGFGYDEEMHPVFGAMVGNHYDRVGFKEYPSRELSIDNAGKY